MRSKLPKTDYSQVAKYYDEVRAIPPSLLTSRIIEYGEVVADSIVLDVGCGTGRFPFLLSNMKGALFVGLEPSIEMLRKAAEKGKSNRICWVRGDGQKLPFRDNVFDCGYMTMVIHHIENKKASLIEIHRTLRKRGKCVVMTTSHTRIRKHILNEFPGVTAIDLERFPTVPSLKKTMIESGFREVHYHSVESSENVCTEEYLKRVRNRYVSTLTLLDENKFRKGFKLFEQRIRKKYGTRFTRVSGFVFVVGCK